jgi:hypothetical protein
MSLAEATAIAMVQGVRELEISHNLKSMTVFVVFTAEPSADPEAVGERVKAALARDLPDGWSFEVRSKDRR